MTIDTQHPIAATPLAHLHQPVSWLKLENGRLPERYREDESAEDLHKAALIDLSALARTGLRGIHAAAVLEQAGVHLPDRPNMASQQPDSSWVARLSHSEYLLLQAPDAGEDSHNTGLPALPHQNKSGCYPLPRQDSHAWFALTGDYAVDTLAKLCGVDLSEPDFKPGAIAQTSVARINAIVINASLPSLPCFYLLFDNASSHYLWQALLDALAEFEGKPAGIGMLRAVISAS